MILFFQRLIGHWVLLHFNLTHIIFCALFAHASFSKIFILTTFVSKPSCAIREFKQITTATSTTAVVDAVSWGEYVS